MLFQGRERVGVRVERKVGKREKELHSEGEDMPERGNGRLELDMLMSS